MNFKSTPQHHDDRDLVFLYALQVLPAIDVPAAEAHISSCTECQQELETLRPIVGSFVSWPTDVVRPSQSLWPRLAQRIGNATGAEPLLVPPEISSRPQWEEAAPGIHVKILSRDEERDMVSMLVRLDPGTDYPAHVHANVEELHLLQGILNVDDRTLYPGDFIRAEAGSVDKRVWSETGCTCFLMTSTKDELF
jgi:anti-sigma factor ChrR (cupin superfamily)